MRRMIMLGPPGAGKGTQAKRLAEHLRVPAISTGDIFRANIEGSTALGRLVQSYLDVGRLVPDEVTNDLVRDRLGQADCIGGFILDGYPRTLAQVDELDGMLKALDAELDRVVQLTVDVDEVVERLLKPAELSIRAVTTTSPRSSGTASRSTSSRPRRWSTSTGSAACWCRSTAWAPSTTSRPRLTAALSPRPPLTRREAVVRACERTDRVQDRRPDPADAPGRAGGRRPLDCRPRRAAAGRQHPGARRDRRGQVIRSAAATPSLPRLQPPALPGHAVHQRQRRGRARHPRRPRAGAPVTWSRSTAARSWTGGTATRRLHRDRSGRCRGSRWPPAR